MYLQMYSAPAYEFKYKNQRNQSFCKIKNISNTKKNV